MLIRLIILTGLTWCFGNLVAWVITCKIENHGMIDYPFNWRIFLGPTYIAWAKQRHDQRMSEAESVYAYPEINPNVDLDQLLKTFPELSVHGSVCRDCGMDDQGLNRELRCPSCTALHDQKEAQK